uniref:Uncharacterized protein n=1 Tax=Romanomermis culicivorax TaxID=13658 RepID=A0A915K4D0_ROMCU
MPESVFIYGRIKYVCKNGRVRDIDLIRESLNINSITTALNSQFTSVENAIETYSDPEIKEPTSPVREEDFLAELEQDRDNNFGVIYQKFHFREKRKILGKVKFKNDGQNSSFDDFYSEVASVVSLLKKPGTSLNFVLWPTTNSESVREQAILSVAFAVDLTTDRNPSQKSNKLGDFLSDHFAKCFELGNVYDVKCEMYCLQI